MLGLSRKTGSPQKASMHVLADCATESEACMHVHRLCESCMHLHDPRVDRRGKPCAREGRMASGSRDCARKLGAVTDAGQLPACTCTER